MKSSADQAMQLAGCECIVYSGIPSPRLNAVGSKEEN